MIVLFAESDVWTQDLEFREQLARAIRQAYQEARELLPEIPEDVTFVCEANELDTIPETGSGGYTRHSRFIVISINPGFPSGKEKIISDMRGVVFHELHHAARYESGVYHRTFLEIAIMEGLATVFERDYASSKPLWGNYNSEDARLWLQEVIDTTDLDHYQYMFKHPDGRRWVGYKVGTYIIDRATKASDKSILELTALTGDEILTLAGIDHGTT